VVVVEGDYPTPAVLRNVTLSDNSGTHGAAILVETGAKLLLDNSIVGKNNATYSVIEARPGTELELRNTRILDNMGSAVNFTGRKLAITGASFTSNTAPFGAGVLLGHTKGRGDVARAVIRNSTFTKNKVSKEASVATHDLLG
jgi:hypothetical protein